VSAGVLAIRWIATRAVQRGLIVAWAKCGANSDKHSKTPERHWITHGRAKRDSTGQTGGSGVDRVADQLTRLSASHVRARLRVGSPGASRKA